MQIWKNMDHMGDLTYVLLSRGILLSAVLLAAGCIAILSGRWPVAEICRELSSLALLLGVATSCYIAKKE